MRGSGSTGTGDMWEEGVTEGTVAKGHTQPAKIGLWGWGWGDGLKSPKEELGSTSGVPAVTKWPGEDLCVMMIFNLIF